MYLDNNSNKCADYAIKDLDKILVLKEVSE